MFSGNATEVLTDEGIWPEDSYDDAPTFSNNFSPPASPTLNVKLDIQYSPHSALSCLNSSTLGGGSARRLFCCNDIMSTRVWKRPSFFQSCAHFILLTPRELEEARERLSRLYCLEYGCIIVRDEYTQIFKYCWFSVAFSMKTYLWAVNLPQPLAYKPRSKTHRYSDGTNGPKDRFIICLKSSYSMIMRCDDARIKFRQLLNKFKHVQVVLPNIPHLENIALY